MVYGVKKNSVERVRSRCYARRSYASLSSSRCACRCGSLKAGEAGFVDEWLKHGSICGVGAAIGSRCDGETGEKRE